MLTQGVDSVRALENTSVPCTELAIMSWRSWAGDHGGQSTHGGQILWHLQAPAIVVTISTYW